MVLRTSPAAGRDIFKTLKSIIMKITVRMAFLLLTAPVLFSSCSNEVTGSAKPSGNKSTEGENSIRFKVNGQPVITTAWVITRFTMNGHAGINITSNMKKDKRTVQFNINGETPGTYKLFTGAKSTTTGYGDYKPDWDQQLNSYSFQDGSFVLTHIDTVKGKISGHFSGIVRNARGQTLTITDGEIVNGELNKDVIHY
jgi:hypothetical protein